MRAQNELLAFAGMLPRDLGRLAWEIDARRTKGTVVEVLERHYVDEAVFDDLLGALGVLRPAS